MNITFTKGYRHVLYGFGEMKVGEQKAFTPDYGDNILQLRCHLTSYGVYYKKKFKTKTVGSQLVALRVK